MFDFQVSNCEETTVAMLDTDGLCTTVYFNAERFKTVINVFVTDRNKGGVILNDKVSYGINHVNTTQTQYGVKTK